MPKPRVNENSSQIESDTHCSIWDESRTSPNIGTDQDCAEHLSYLAGSVGSGDADMAQSDGMYGPMTMRYGRMERILRKHTVDQGLSTFTKDEFRKNGGY
jgi:hypothetical protein